MNPTEFRWVHNQKETRHCDHIPLNQKGICLLKNIFPMKKELPLLRLRACSSYFLYMGSNRKYIIIATNLGIHKDRRKCTIIIKKKYALINILSRNSDCQLNS